MSFVRGSNSALSSSIFFFSSSSSMSRPSFVMDFNFLPSNSLSCCTAYSSIGSTMYITSKPFFAECFQERRRRDGSNALASDIIYIILPFFHTVHIFLEADLLVARLRRL